MDSAVLDVLPLRACPRIYICYVLTPGLPASAASSLVYFPKKKQNAGDGASFQFHFSLDVSWFYLR
jgi:hypothetical protein